MMTAFKPWSGRVLLTLAMLACAGAFGWNLWSYYMLAPWTRDGHVRADVVGVASDVSGLVTEVLVHDNAQVEVGQPLFRVDPQRYQIALDQAEADLASAKAARDFARTDADRYNQLAQSSAVSVSAQQQVETQRLQAEATYEKALAARDLARLNLQRSTVVAAVAGRITNFTLRPGDYASAGTRVASLIATETVHVSGYFEETKLPRIQIGDEAKVVLMGSHRVLTGRVKAISWGIADQQRTEVGGALPSVTPTFTWVRLAQRVPVDIVLDGDQAKGLIVGTTATVEIVPGTTPTAGTP